MEAISTSWLPKLFCQTMIYPVNINLLTIAICNTNYQNIFICKCLLVLAIRTVAIRFGVIRLVVCAQKCYTLGGSGGMLPMRMLLRPFLGQYDAFWRPDYRVSHECHSAHCIIDGVDFRCSLLIGRKPHPSQVKLCETSYHSLVTTESCWKEDSWDSSVALFAAISQLSTW